MTLSLESNALNPLNRLFSCRVFNPCLPLCILALMSLSTYAAANENTQKPVAAKKTGSFCTKHGQSFTQIVT